ncbi:hypothetical protein ILUMI_26773 [Ignelater luminosus]|uniref:Uncharacterized protein n=1 Tax=Ignelater luminosus TaxID=2038154 RepID=A0A8K0C974_IGNLU|nr:hypothetical protein ILUMI_26773 [Ignelater luminosus]
MGTLLDNNCFRTAIALRLGSKVCHPHTCRCGFTVNPRGTHELSCKFNVGRHPRHNELNDILKRPLLLVDVPSIRERKDEKRPDEMTLIPWVNGQPLVWNATCSDILALLNLPFSLKTTGSVTERQVTNKKSKCKHENAISLSHSQKRPLNLGIKKQSNSSTLLVILSHKRQGNRDLKPYSSRRLALQFKRKIL